MDPDLVQRKSALWFYKNFFSSLEPIAWLPWANGIQVSVLQFIVGGFEVLPPVPQNERNFLCKRDKRDTSSGKDLKVGSQGSRGP